MLELGRDIDGGEARLALAFGVERRHAREAVRAALAVHVAVGKRPDDAVRHFGDARLRAERARDLLDLPAHLLEVVEVHALEHARPVFRLGSAGAGLDRDEAVAVVVLARQQRLLLDLVHLRLEAEERLVDLGEHLAVAGLLGELVADLRVLEKRDGLLERLDHGADDLALLDDLLGGLRVVPELLGVHAVVERGPFGELLIVVKASRGAC